MTCEDYPCCGHDRGTCGDDNDTTDLFDFHYERMSHPDYDSYYDSYDF